MSGVSVRPHDGAHPRRAADVLPGKRYDVADVADGKSGPAAMAASLASFKIGETVFGLIVKP